MVLAALYAVIHLAVAVTPAESLATARTELKRKKKDTPALVRTQLTGVKDWADPAQRADALQLLAQAELLDKKPEVAVRRYQEALGALDDAFAPARARTRVQRSLKDVVTRSKNKTLLEGLDALKTADSILEAAEKWPVLPGVPTVPSAEALDTAVKTFSSAGLAQRATRARALLAVAQGTVGRKEALELAQQAWREAPEQTSPETRRLRVALLRASARARVALLRADRKAAAPVHLAVKDALEADAQEAPLTGLVAPYLRSAVTVTLADAVDVVEGVGATRRMEDVVGVEHSFRDFSLLPATSVLLDEDVTRTQGEYGFLLNRCLADHARRDVELAGIRFELTWVVQPHGQADEFQMDPRRLREHAVAGCLKKAVGTFRYPPYKSGERRVVTVPLQVSG